MNSLQVRLARRYLFSRKSHSVINMIAAVSVAAVAVPVAAMIILMSVFNGFASLVQDMYASFDADVEITAASSARLTESQVARLQSVTAEVEGVEALSFYLEAEVVLSHGERQTVAVLRGVDSLYGSVVPIAHNLTRGTAEVQLGELDRVLAGQGIVYSLGLWSQAERDVDIYALGNGRFSALLPLAAFSVERREVCGIYALDAQTDSRYALTSLRFARALFGGEGRATAAAVKAHDGSRVAAELQRAVGEEFKVRTREQKNSAFYRIMRYEKWGIFFISLLVLAVASCSIIGSLMMLIIDKRKDTATLRALGADSGFVRGIFGDEAVLISLVGMVGGIVTGVAVVAAQARWGMVKMPSGAFVVENYPVELHWGDVAAVCAACAAVTAAVAVVTTRLMIRTRDKTRL